MKLSDELIQLHPENNARYRWSDIGNGNLFADVFKSCARYVPERKSWFVYDGKRWKQDVSGTQASELCKQLANALSHYALDLRDPLMRDNYLKFVGRWQKKQVRNTVLGDALSVYTKSFGEFDSAPWMLNLQNGTLDLQTGKLHSHNPSDFLTMLAGTSYDPSAKCPRWLEFIDEITEGNKDLARYIQKVLGYALSGDISEEKCFVFYGPTTRNGKNTLIEPFMKALGEYASVANPATFAEKKFANASGPSEDIARLAGKRFVTLAEPGENMILDASRLKAVTGGDTIIARLPFELSFEFQPECTLVFNANFLPRCSDPAVFSSERMCVIPFNRHFEPAEQDHKLKSYFKSAKVLPAILNWAVEGVRLYQAEGLAPPEAVRVATEVYAQQEGSRPAPVAVDAVEQFVREMFESDPFAETKSSDAFAAFVDWCSLNKRPATSVQAFGRGINRWLPSERKRPRGGGEKTSIITGYRLRN